MKNTQKAKNQGGRPVAESIRWTIDKACLEFSFDRLSLKKGLARESIEPDEDGRYSTSKIARVVFGDLAAEKLRKAKADATAAEIETSKLLRPDEPECVILASDADQLWADAIVRIRETIEHAKFLEDAQKERLLSELQNITLEP